MLAITSKVGKSDASVSIKASRTHRASSMSSDPIVDLTEYWLCPATISVKEPKELTAGRLVKPMERNTDTPKATTRSKAKVLSLCRVQRRIIIRTARLRKSSALTERVMLIG